MFLKYECMQFFVHNQFHNILEFKNRGVAAIVQNVFWLIVTFEVICKRNFRHVQLPNCNLRFQHHLFAFLVVILKIHIILLSSQNKSSILWLIQVQLTGVCNLIDSSDQLKQFNDSYDNGSSWVIIQFHFSSTNISSFYKLSTIKCKSNLLSIVKQQVFG